MAKLPRIPGCLVVLSHCTRSGEAAETGGENSTAKRWAHRSGRSPTPPDSQGPLGSEPPRPGALAPPARPPAGAPDSPSAGAPHRGEHLQAASGHDSRHPPRSRAQNAQKTSRRRVEYPWHPLFGQEVVVRSEFCRAGEAVVRCQVSEDERGDCLRVPAWMFERARCAMLQLCERPSVTVEALRTLKELLHSSWMASSGRVQDRDVQPSDVGGIDAAARVSDNTSPSPISTRRHTGRARDDVEGSAGGSEGRRRRAHCRNASRASRAKRNRRGGR